MANKRTKRRVWKNDPFVLIDQSLSYRLPLRDGNKVTRGNPGEVFCCNFKTPDYATMTQRHKVRYENGNKMKISTLCLLCVLESLWHCIRWDLELAKM